MLEREPPVPGDVVGMGVRLEGAGQLDLLSRALIQVLLDRVGRVDHDGNACVLVTDEVRRTAEVVVDELLEEHEDDASTGCSFIS
jgi:hypothetical protein